MQAGARRFRRFLGWLPVLLTHALSLGSLPAMNLRLFLVALTLSVVQAGAAGPGWWPQFRGPNADGLGEGKPPEKWDAAKGERVLWKQPVPGLALASPVVWDTHVFVTTAVSGTDNAELKIGL